MPVSLTARPDMLSSSDRARPKRLDEGIVESIDGVTTLALAMLLPSIESNAVSSGVEPSNHLSIVNSESGVAEWSGEKPVGWKERAVF